MTKVKFLKDQRSPEGLMYEKGKTVELYDDAYAHELVRRKIAEDVKEGKDAAAEPEPVKHKAEEHTSRHNPAPEPEESRQPFRTKGK